MNMFATKICVVNNRFTTYMKVFFSVYAFYFLLHKINKNNLYLFKYNNLYLYVIIQDNLYICR